MKSFYSLKVFARNRVNSVKVWKNINTEAFACKLQILHLVVIITVFSIHFYTTYNYHTGYKYLCLARNTKRAMSTRQRDTTYGEGIKTTACSSARTPRRCLGKASRRIRTTKSDAKTARKWATRCNESTMHNEIR